MAGRELGGIFIHGLGERHGYVPSFTHQLQFVISVQFGMMYALVEGGVFYMFVYLHVLVMLASSFGAMTYMQAAVSYPARCSNWQGAAASSVRWGLPVACIYVMESALDGMAASVAFRWASL